jgi:hypothetical protein
MAHFKFRTWPWISLAGPGIRFVVFDYDQVVDDFLYNENMFDLSS